MTAAAIEVTARDPETDETGTRTVEPGDYCLIAVEPLYLDGVQKYANGTTVLTLKQRAL